MNLRASLIVMLIGCIGFMAEALPKDNYGTDACTQLVTRANSLYNKGKYAEAKVLYEQALATGDKFFAKKCTQQLHVINTLLGSQQKKRQTTVFTISQDTVKINHLGGDYPIHVSGDNWSAIQPKDDWCHIEIDKKLGIVKIYSAPNESTSDRSAFITVKNGNGQKKTIEVINEGSPEILRSSAQNLMFTPTGETNVVDIDANTDWSIADVPGWLQAIKGQGDIQFTAGANDGNKDRIAQVKVETPSKQEITINIIQGARLDSLAFSKNDLRFGPDGGDEYIRVLTDADDWRFGSFPHWCQLERIDNNTIKVHCTANEPVDMPREASVNVTTGNQTLGIDVYQEPKPIFNVIPQDGIGGRRISFGFEAGYIHPFIDASSSSPFTFSPVNYAQGNELEQVSYSSKSGFSVAVFADMRLYKNLYLKAGLNFLFYKYENNVSGDFDRTIQSVANCYLRGKVLSSFSEQYTSMSLDIPVLVSYRVPLTKKSHLQLNVGPVLDLGLSSNLDFSGKANSEDLRAYKIVNGQMTDIPYDQGRHSSHLNYSGKFNMYEKKVNLNWYTSDGGNGIVTDPYDFDTSPYNRVNFGLRFGIGYEFMGISLNVFYQWMVSNMANRKFWESDRWTVFNNATQLMTGYNQHNNLLMVTLGYTLRY